ncbi:MAG: hypothetical protein WD232_08110 [Acidimicrobiales bacterium]
MSTAHCPLCGETYLAAATVCADCRVALVLDPPEGHDALPVDDSIEAEGGAVPDVVDLAWPDGDDEIGYDLDDWVPEDRVILSDALRGERVAHEWRGGEVVVPERFADVAEELIDAIDHPDALDADDDGDDDGGAELLSALYVASDVLAGDPHASGAVVEVLELAPDLAGRSTPYGVDGRTWTAVLEQATGLAELLEEDADGDEVQGAAAALRRLVRPLV